MKNYIYTAQDWEVLQEQYPADETVTIEDTDWVKP